MTVVDITRANDEVSVDEVSEDEVSEDELNGTPLNKTLPYESGYVFLTGKEELRWVDDGIVRVYFPFGSADVDWHKWLQLRLAADALTDIQKLRTAASNRVNKKSATVEAHYFEGLLYEATISEKLIVKDLISRFRAVAPDLARWIKTVPGLGIPSIARYVGATGHPLIGIPLEYAPKKERRQENLIQGSPFLRTQNQLLSYSGFGDPMRRHRKGMSETEARACGNPAASVAVWNIVEAAFKAVGGRRRHQSGTTYEAKRSPIRVEYDRWSTHYASNLDMNEGRRVSASKRRTGKHVVSEIHRVSLSALAAQAKRNGFLPE